MNHLRSQLDSVHENHVALDEAFQQMLANKFHELKVALQQESQVCVMRCFCLALRNTLCFLIDEGAGGRRHCSSFEPLHCCSSECVIYCEFYMNASF